MSRIIEISGCPASGKSTIMRSLKSINSDNFALQDSYRFKMRDLRTLKNIILSPEIKLIRLMIFSLMFRSDVNILIRLKLVLYVLGRFCNHRYLELRDLNFVVDEGKFHSIFNVVPYLKKDVLRFTLFKILDNMDFDHRVVYLKSTKEVLLDRFKLRQSGDHWFLRHCEGDCLKSFLDKLLVMEDILHSNERIDLIERSEVPSLIEEICIQFQEN